MGHPNVSPEGGDSAAFGRTRVEPGGPEPAAQPGRRAAVRKSVSITTFLLTQSPVSYHSIGQSPAGYRTPRAGRLRGGPARHPGPFAIQQVGDSANSVPLQSAPRERRIESEGGEIL